MRIWKYTLNDHETKLRTPTEWNPVAVGYQEAGIVIWAEVEISLTREPEVDRIVMVVPTGPELWRLLEGFEHLGTVTDPDGLVWHVYVDQGNPT